MKGDRNMKPATGLFLGIALLGSLSCTNKQQPQPKTIPDKEIAASGKNDKDTIRYYIPECFLVDVQDLWDEPKDTSVVMWMEHTTYGTDVEAIHVFVDNPTTTPLTYGRDWYLHRWNGKEWVMPKIKGPDIAWFSDGFDNRKAPSRYWFCFPISSYYYLPKGKYRISKSFYAGGQEIALSAEFEIR